MFRDEDGGSRRWTGGKVRCRWPRRRTSFTDDQREFLARIQFEARGDYPFAEELLKLVNDIPYLLDEIEAAVFAAYEREETVDFRFLILRLGKTDWKVHYYLSENHFAAMHRYIQWRHRDLPGLFRNARLRVNDRLQCPYCERWIRLKKKPRPTAETEEERSDIIETLYTEDDRQFWGGKVKQDEPDWTESDEPVHCHWPEEE